ncbi:MAG: universal stress protein [Anaerolineales bacterium]|jgi:nucleotide-binding universal stress UspA family protein
MMGGILCPIRGGPGSRGAIAAGISLAKEIQEPLHFLYVVNLDFLNLTERGRTQVISEEMRGMGEFILLRAQAQAEQNGIKAQWTVRQGNVMDEIMAMAKEIEASHIILGQPKHEEQNVFTMERLKTFVEHCEKETGAKVVLAETGGDE